MPGPTVFKVYGEKLLVRWPGGLVAQCRVFARSAKGPNLSAVMFGHANLIQSSMYSW